MLNCLLSKINKKIMYVLPEILVSLIRFLQSLHLFPAVSPMRLHGWAGTLFSLSCIKSKVLFSSFRFTNRSRQKLNQNIQGSGLTFIVQWSSHVSIPLFWHSLHRCVPSSQLKLFKVPPPWENQTKITKHNLWLFDGFIQLSDLSLFFLKLC